MQFVKLVVPQQLYNELKLQRNQTISLSNSEIFHKADTPGLNVSAASNSERISIENHQPLKAEPELNDNCRAKEFFHDNSGASVLTLVVNVGIRTQKILTYHLKSVRVVSIGPSDLASVVPKKASHNTGDPASTVKELNTNICESQSHDNNKTVCMNPKKTALKPRPHYSNNGISIIPQESHLNKQLLTEPQSKEEIDDGESDDSSPENHDDSFFADVNAEDENQEVPIFYEKSALRVSNEPLSTSSHSDGMNTATRENNSKSCDSSATNVSHRNKPSAGFLPSSKTICVIKRKPVVGECRNTKKLKMERKTKPAYLRHCEFCKLEFSNRSDFLLHPRSCVLRKTKTQIQLPRSCANCKNQFETEILFSNHKKKCGVKEKITYPRCCTNCNRNFDSQYEFIRHNKKCARNKTKDKPIIVYPRPCIYCNRLYASKRSISNHRAACLGLGPKPITGCCTGTKGKSLPPSSGLNRPCVQKNDRRATNQTKTPPSSKKVKVSYPRECPICGRSCANWPAFTEHLRACQTKNFKKYKESGATNVVDKPGFQLQESGNQWIPVKIPIGSKKELNYFVVKNTLPESGFVSHAHVL